MTDNFVLIMDPTEIKQKGTSAETFQTLQFWQRLTTLNKKE
jgi:hypothetical protein